MKKLIELDAALDALREVIVPAEDIGFGDELTDGYNDGINMAVTVVSGLPTVDAVEVVRCRECRWWGVFPGSTAAPTYHDCKARGISTDADDFCKRGERKDGDEHEVD